MRAWVIEQLGAPRDALALRDIDVPDAGPGEIRLRVLAAALGLPDALMCRGRYAFKPTLPFVAGQEVCGIVDAVGDGVDDGLVGTRLMAVTNFFNGDGGFAEYSIASTASAFRVPDAMSDADAACFRIGYSTAWIGLVRRGGLVEGDWLLVLGAAGGSGIAAVRLGRALGARVIAVVSGDAKRALCEVAGAEAVIDRSSVSSVVDAVNEVTEGRGVDLVYDPVGGKAAGDTVGCLATGGRILAVGFASGSWVDVDIARLVRRNASIVGVYAGGLTRAEQEADHEALLELLAENKLESATRSIAFDDLPNALESVASAEAVGKFALTMAD